MRSNKMKINGYQIEGNKSDYIDILVKYQGLNEAELNKQSFKEVVTQYCFYYMPLVCFN